MTEADDQFRHPYPDAAHWQGVKEVNKRDVYRFARLWLTEGLPYVFQSVPLKYELGREKLAGCLSDDPKHVCVAGSGRIGFAMNPRKFGVPFSNKSDLDIFMVSDNLFNRMAAEVDLFINRFENGLALPRNDAEERFWPDNVMKLRRDVNIGMINHTLMPSGEPYPITSLARRGLTQFNYAATGHVDGGELYRKATIRIYRSWDRAIAQIGGALVRTLSERGCKIV